MNKRQVQKKAQQVQMQFQSLVENVPGIVYRCALDADWTIHFISSKVELLTGYPASDFINNSVRTIASVIHPEDSSLVERCVNEAVDAGVPWDIKYRVCHKDGNIHWVHEKGQGVLGQDSKVEYLDGVVLDITEQKLANDKLIEDENKYRILVESSRSAIMTLEPPLWKFTAGNAATVEMFGVKDEAEFISLGPCDLSPLKQPDGQLSAEKAKEIIERAMQEGSYFFEWTHRRLNGEDFPVSVLLTRYECRGKTLLQATVYDITAQKKAEAEVQKAQKRLETILRKSPFGVVIIDKNRKIHWANEYAVQIAGLKNLNELVDQYCGEYLCPAAKQECPILDKGQTVDNSERIIRRHDGKEIPVLKTVTEVDIYGEQMLLETFVDITEQKEIEKELQQSKDFLQLIIDAQPDFLTVVDLNHRICLANKAYIEKVKCGDPIKDELYCYQVSRHRETPCTGEDGLCAIQQVLTAQASVTFEHTHCSRKDEAKYVESIASPIFNKEGQIVHVVEVCRDITDRKQAEEKLRMAKREAEEANKSKGQFLANMSHEIRTPMNAIVGFSDLLADEDLNEDQMEFVNLIRVAGKNLLAIINDILDFSKIEAKKLEIESVEFSLEEMLHEFDSIMRPAVAKKNLKYEVIQYGKLPQMIKSDPTRIRQCLTNLINNAIKFTEEGHVFLQVSTDRREGRDCIIFDVEDTGIGISQDKVETVFQEFNQADNTTTRKFGGTGLGLSITCRLAELLGGSLSVASEPGKGSTFTLAIPAGVDINAVTEANKYAFIDSFNKLEQSEQKILLTGKVLAAEDNPSNQTLIKMLLEKLGLKVTIVDDGQQALDAAKKEIFDIIFMDIQMPHMNGYEATKQIRKEGITTPIVALTAHAVKGDDKKCFEAGCDDFLAKPIDSKKLYKIISKYVSQQEGSLEKLKKDLFL